MTGTQTPAVHLDGITKRFGDVTANDDVDFTLESGSVHALIGENGAGKSTLMGVLFGLYDHDAGTISVDGTPRTFGSSHDAIDAGIGMIHQHFQLVDTMTVLDNIIISREPTKHGLIDETRARAKIEDICTNYGFNVDDHLNTRIENLGVGVQQRVEIVKSLYRGSEVLILDEPTAVLTPQEVSDLFDVMETLIERGNSLIFITHKIDEAMAAADEITVLRDGHVVGTVDAGDTSKNELARMMVGRDVLLNPIERNTEPGDVTVEVSGVSVSGDRNLEQVTDVDLSVRSGEILGIAGIEGNGQTEFVEALTGIRGIDAGTIHFDGIDITDVSRQHRIEAGMAYVPGDRQEMGLVQAYDLVWNALLGNQSIEPYASRGILDWESIRQHADAIIDKFDVETPGNSTAAHSLSGGNQQKFIVGREVKRSPKLIVAVNPTRGVDIGAIEFIHEHLGEMRDEGVAILLVSSKLDEIQNLSDRIRVMYEGELSQSYEPDDITEEELGLLMTGRERKTDGANSAAGGGSTDNGVGGAGQWNGN